MTGHPRLSGRLGRTAMLAVAALTGSAAAQDWPNIGANAARNGLTTVVGPITPDLAWRHTEDYSVYTFHPFVHDGRVFIVRQSWFPEEGGAANDVLVVYDLQTGLELWRLTLPYAGDPSEEWTAWIAGANAGHVYASRAAFGKPEPIHAYDAASGTHEWTSEWETVSSGVEGAVFAPDGDLIVGDQGWIVRIDAPTGATVWSTPRDGSYDGGCGAAAALTSSAVYIIEPLNGGQVITRIDLDSGARQYSSPIMPVSGVQNSPFVSPDATTVYLPGSQLSPGADYLCAFQDTGTALVELWRRPMFGTFYHSHGVAADGCIYTCIPGDEFVRLDPATGAVLNSAGTLSTIRSPHTAVDGLGNVYVSNGVGPHPSPVVYGRLWMFSADLSENYLMLTLDQPRQGGPVLAGDGVLVVADRVGVYAYCVGCGIPGDLDHDGDVDLADLAALLAMYDTCEGDPGYDPAGDLDGSGCVDLADLAELLSHYGAGRASSRLAPG